MCFLALFEKPNTTRTTQGALVSRECFARTVPHLVYEFKRTVARPATSSALLPNTSNLAAQSVRTNVPHKTFCAKSKRVSNEENTSKYGTFSPIMLSTCCSVVSLIKLLAKKEKCGFENWFGVHQSVYTRKKNEIKGDLIRQSFNRSLFNAINH